MASIKALGDRTIHQIQSGQVIVDLCSVVKELVENSLDAGATSIEIRFRNYGLESIEVQDNGIGIACDNYETIALKHYTSKLSSYDDLSSLQTFGFRGEALSSLCALSTFYVTTARAHEAPKGTRLNFEVSGKLKSTQVIACQKGTTIAVEDIFRNLPVRRRELEKNIKREYSKALGLLQAYACISTQARISVSNILAKGKKIIAFATGSNSTTRENIAKVFGTKALPGLIPMDLSFEMRPAKTHSQLCDPSHKRINVYGHVSRPTLGEGRQAPDRQLFFVNGRPCILPQIARIFNEVYKIYNISQSPFVFANLILNTDAYDVNVSPDKRTILLHEQNALLDTLKASLMGLFDKQEQFIPISQKPTQRLPAFKKLSVDREESNRSNSTALFGEDTHKSPKQRSANIGEGEILSAAEDPEGDRSLLSKHPTSLIEDFAGRESKERSNRSVSNAITDSEAKALSKDEQKLIKKLGENLNIRNLMDNFGDPPEPSESDTRTGVPSVAVHDFNERLAEQQQPVPAIKGAVSDNDEFKEEDFALHAQKHPPISSIVQDAFDRMRPRRNVPKVATITVGSKTTTSILASSPSRFPKNDEVSPTSVNYNVCQNDTASSNFSNSVRSFVAPENESVKTVGKPQWKSRSSSHHTQEPDYGSGYMTGSSPSSRSEDESSNHNSNDDDDDPGDVEEMGLQGSPSSKEDYEESYFNEDEKKVSEEAKVAGLIRRAEEALSVPSQDSRKRAHHILKGSGQRESTTHLIQGINTTVDNICNQLWTLMTAIRTSLHELRSPSWRTIEAAENASPEERLSLKVSKTDFNNMHICGQFNLGFILAARNNADLFIIDQHASDEKYNFENLQATTVVQNQRLVQPRVLELTAVEEEIILQHNDALLKNGFMITLDTSGESTVGRRCRLVSLPMSHGVTFDVTDLEELIALLADSSATSSTGNVTRPSKVRRMFAMRACRSSVMVGKTLTLKQMEALVRKMSEIDKPWNCPHGRPTMRHLCGLGGLETWSEEDGLVGLEEEPQNPNWRSWVSTMKCAAEVVDSGDHQAGVVGDHCGKDLDVAPGG